MITADDDHYTFGYGAEESWWEDETPEQDSWWQKLMAYDPGVKTAYDAYKQARAAGISPAELIDPGVAKAATVSKAAAVVAAAQIEAEAKKRLRSAAEGGATAGFVVGALLVGGLLLFLLTKKK